MWQYRTFYGHNTVNAGWGPWEEVVPRNPITETVADRVREIQTYIESGYRYELRVLYTPPASDTDSMQGSQPTKEN